MINYYELIARTRQQIRQQDIYDPEGLLTQFSFFCANMRRFIPSVPFCEYENLFLETLLRSTLSLIDEDYPAISRTLQITEPSQDWWEMITSKPGIICTFHSGSYRLLMRLMAQRAIPIAVLMSGDVLAQQEADLYKHFSAVGGKAAFRLIDATRPDVIRVLGKALADGCQLIWYADGQTGVAGHSSRHQQTVPFLNSRLLVKTTMQVLAHWHRVPIYPVFAQRPADDCICFITLEPLPARSRNDTDAGLVGVYTCFSTAIRQYIPDWEGWLYLHEGGEAHIADSVKDSRMLFPWAIGTQKFGIQADSYQLYQIDDVTFCESLSKCQLMMSGF